MVGREARKVIADQFAANVLPVIRELQSAGTTSLNAIAAGLNARRITTKRGARWTHGKVANVLNRLPASPDIAR